MKNFIANAEKKLDREALSQRALENVEKIPVKFYEDEAGC